MEMEREEEHEHSKARALIERATNSTSPEIDPRILKAIKYAVRYSDSELRIAAQCLMDLMKRDHSQVRYLALLIIDEFFMRSKLFRTIVVENFDQLLALSVGFRRNLPLPAPQSVASRLRSKAIEFLEKWNASFGIHYRQLRLGFEYLKNNLRFQFPNLQANIAHAQLERRERELRTQEILRNKFETLRVDFSSIKEEINSTVEEIGQCLEIASAKEDLPFGPIDDDDFEEFRSSELRQIRLDSLKEGEKVHENSDNKAVFDALRELYKLLMTKHLVSIQEWISVLIRVDAADKRFRDSVLKEFIDIRNHLLAVKKKCEESGCTPSDAKRHGKEEEEEDFWEEYKVESIEFGSSGTPSKQNGDLATRSTSGKDKKVMAQRKKNNLHGGETSTCGGSGNISSTIRSKLLAEAPVVELGSQLHTWGENRDVMANHRGLELESHWGRVDHDAIIPADKIAELNVQATLYKEEPVEIQSCRAPLRKGGLCLRRDLRVCPFHGPIIPRDDQGNPVDQGNPYHQSSSTDERDVDYSPAMTTDDFGSDLVEQIAKQAVKNVRDRDNEEARKEEIEKRSLKRAKLAKVRDHNRAVLRDAAIASTSRSATLGEEMDLVGGESLSSARNKKQTLASMLRNKVTTKDRIAQKLLNTRVRDASVRQLTQGEDSIYREAFPNQW